MQKITKIQVFFCEAGTLRDASWFTLLFFRSLHLVLLDNPKYYWKLRFTPWAVLSGELLGAWRAFFENCGARFAT